MNLKRFAALMLTVLVCMTGLNGAASADEPEFSSMEDLLEYLYYDHCYLLNEEDITFYYTEALDDVFSTPDALWDILANCGMDDWEQTRYTSQRKVTIESIVYAPGFRIGRAWQMDQLHILTDEEREIYEIAQGMVEEAQMKATSRFDLLVRLHDMLVRRVVYLGGDEGGYWDTAVGALKYGEAECDGYADSFYLLATLAGFEAGYQHGDTEGADEDESHIWNVLCWDGWWYQIDVTWDDKDRDGAPGMCTYRYFNVAATTMEDHYWNPDYSPFNQATYNNWDIFYYTNGIDAFDNSIYCSTMAAAADRAVYIQKNSNYSSLHIMVDGTYEDAVYFNDVLQDHGLRGRWTTWTKNMGEYTLFDVLFLDE